nr:antitoxin VapB family protein [Candidatus Njordarchaeota archaeon]
MTKIVSLSEKAYESLKKLKRDGESFSDVVTRLTSGEEPKSLLPFAGKWVGDDLEKVFHRVMEDRKKSVSREVTL